MAAMALANIVVAGVVINMASIGGSAVSCQRGGAQPKFRCSESYGEINGSQRPAGASSP